MEPNNKRSLIFKVKNAEYLVGIWPYKRVKIQGSFLGFDVCGKFIKFGTFFKIDGKFRIDGSGSFWFKIFWSDFSHDGDTILGEDLSEFGDKWDAFTHTFDLNWSMFFHDHFAEEKTFVETGWSTYSVNVGFVEFTFFLFGLFAHLR